MPDFKLDPAFTPTADQPKAIEALARGVGAGERFQTLLGATGTGKTMTMAGVIEAVQRPALVIAHNKTLAAQLCNEFRTFFPDNAVEYFVSYYDYYQPEAYVPSRDLYIEKDSAINQEVDRLRHAATAAVFARRDVIVVASVSCIYGLGSPETYEMNMQILKRGETVDRDALLRKLVSIQYTRNDSVLSRGTFRVRGDTLEVFPAYAETAFRAIDVRRRGRAPAALRPPHGRADRRRPRARGDLAGDPLQRQGRDDRGGGRSDRARARAALRGADRGRQAARGPPPAPAHPVRHGDAARGRLLLGDRELLADPRRPPPGERPVLPDRLLPEGLRVLHRRVPPDGAPDRRHARGRPLAQADARGLRLPAPERARQPAPDLRGVPLDHAPADVRLGDPRRVRADPVHQRGRADRQAHRHRRPGGGGARDRATRSTT